MNPLDLTVTCNELLLKIGGVLDIQGFHVNNTFIPRQLAIITRDTIVRVVDFKTDINYHELSSADRRSVKYVQRNIHHLECEPPVFVNATHASNCRLVIQRLCAEHRITNDRPLAVNNPQAELFLTAADIPFVTLRTLINNLPDTNTIISYYTRGKTAFSASAKVASLWRLIIYKQFEIKSKLTYDHINAGGDIEPLATLIADSHEGLFKELNTIKSGLCTVLTNLERIGSEIDERCPQPTYAECCQDSV